MGFVYERYEVTFALISDLHLEVWWNFLDIRPSMDPLTYDEIDLIQMAGRDVVMLTHHAPFTVSIAKQYKDHPLNPFFVNQLEHRPHHLKPDHMPMIWCHGHVHTQMEYCMTIGNNKCRVYCNPFGYPGERFTDSKAYMPMVIRVWG